MKLILLLILLCACGVTEPQEVEQQEGHPEGREFDPRNR